MELGSSTQSEAIIITSHVLIFPLPMQGSVNTMLNLAQLLLLSTDHNIHITFLTSEFVHRNLLASAEALEHFGRDDRFSFRIFSDSLPDDHPRGGVKFMEMLEAVMSVSHPILEKLVKLEIESKPRVTCIVSDPVYYFALDVGNEVGIPVFYFETMSPSCLWVYFCLPQLIQDGEIGVSFKENKDFDKLINIPGMENFMRFRDLPHFCRAIDATDHSKMQHALIEVKQLKRAQGIILNTFEDFDSLSLSYIHSHYQNPIYTIGPLHLNLKESLHQKSIFSNYSNSFWQEDKKCIEWLNKKPSKSVLYCSFGSQVVITKEQLIEFWHGLVNSETLFLWVKRPKSVIDMDGDFDTLAKCQLLNQDLTEGIKKRGFVASWVPQVDVLNHPSVGGFLTHSGWNSTLESVSAGVPMICWPRRVDQLVISRLVTQVWKIGVDMKDTCDRVIVEKMVKNIMVHMRDELMENVIKYAKLSTKSVCEGGSSCNSILNLIEDIRAYTMQRKTL